MSGLRKHSSRINDVIALVSFNRTRRICERSLYEVNS